MSRAVVYCFGLLISISIFNAAASDEEDKYWVSISDKFNEPLELCDDNFKDMSSFFLSTTRAYGNEPTQKDKDDLKDLHWCECLYKNVAFQTRDLNLQSVVDDLVSIENFERKFSLLKGGKVEDWERNWFTRSLNNGESVMTTYGLSLFNCQQKD